MAAQGDPQRAAAKAQQTGALDVVTTALSVREELREHFPRHDVRSALGALRVPDGNDAGKVCGYLDAAAIL